jgi:hypothetical protein
LSESGIAESRQAGRIWPDQSGQPAGIRPDWSPESDWPDSGEGGWIPSPDSGDINRMLSDSDTGNISMVVGWLTIIFAPTKHRKMSKSFYAETNGT